MRTKRTICNLIYTNMRRKTGRWSSCGLLIGWLSGYGNTRGRLDGGRELIVGSNVVGVLVVGEKDVG